MAALGVLLAVAVAWAVGSAQAQDTCRRTEDLGALRSHQTITRVGLLTSASCRFDDGTYYDFYDFALPGAGAIEFSLSSSDFGERIVLNTGTGEFLSAGHSSLTRTLPAGRYKVIAQSRSVERAGAYTLTVKTKQLAAPPPPPPPPPETRTNGDDVDQDDEQVIPPDETEVVRGQVIARVHPLPENDRRGRYRIEFGFLSAEVLASGTDRTAVVDANKHLLPPRRYLNEASLLARGRANDRRWLRSSPVDVLPLEDDDAGLSGEPLLTGRIIARWNPTAGNTFQVEFGFLPDWAFEAACDDTQRAAELYANLLPESRYFTRSAIDRELHRDQPRWLPSSEVVFVPPKNEPSCAGPITITPAGVPITLVPGERISDEAIATIAGELAETFTPVVVSGLPPGLTYDVEESRADGREYQVTVSGTIPPQTPARDYNAAITAEGADGDPTTGTVLINLGTPVSEIRIRWGGYNPAATSIGGSVGIVQPRVISPFPAPPGVVWSFETRTTDVCTVDSRTGALTLIGAGACQVTVTASAPGYKSATATADVTVVPEPRPTMIWSGYNPSSIEISDAAPTILPRRAMVNGREVYPEYRYSVAPGSSEVCRVNEATGALTISGVGQCRILLTNVAKPPEYGVGSADATVTVRPGDPDLHWQGYSPSTTQLDDPAPRLLRPTADARSIEFSYSTLTPSICGVDSETGALTLMREGNCIVMVSTSGNPNYRTTTARATVVVSDTPPIERPEIVEITCTPSEPRVDQAVRCTAQLDGGEPDSWSWSDDDPIGPNGMDAGDGVEPNPEWSGTAERYSTTFGQSGQRRVSLTVTNSAGSDTDSTTVDVQRRNRGPECEINSNAPRRLYVYGPGILLEVEEVADFCSDPDGDALRFSASSSDSSVVSVSSPSGSRGQFILTGVKLGSARITISATDPDGLSDSASFTVTVTEDRPYISINCPPSVDADEDITCTVSNDGGDIDSYDWSDSDGGSGSGASYHTSFSSSGTKTVSLTAHNSGGSDNDSTTVTVNVAEKPEISISCPSSAEVDENITCTVSNRGGAIDSYDWSGGTASRNDRATYSPSFSSEGSYTVRLTARNAGGSDRDSATVGVIPEPPDPRISCTAYVLQGDRASCRVNRNRGGDIDRYSWSATGGASSGSSSTYRPRFSSYGRQTVRLTASNDGGSGSDSLPVDVLPTPPSTGYARCGSDTVKVYWFDTSTGMKHHIVSWEVGQNAVPGWGEDLIGRLRQGCDTWQDGPDWTAWYDPRIG